MLVNIQYQADYVLHVHQVSTKDLQDKAVVVLVLWASTLQVVCLHVLYVLVANTKDRLVRVVVLIVL